MSQYSVSLDGSVNFAPSNTVEEVLQNVRTILSTVVGSVPLDRDFGVSWDAVDAPIPIAKMKMKVEVINAVEKFEPRARVVSVDFEETEDDAMDGVTRPRVQVEIKDES